MYHDFLLPQERPLGYTRPYRFWSSDTPWLFRASFSLVGAVFVVTSSALVTLLF